MPATKPLNERVVRNGPLNTYYVPSDFINPNAYDTHDGRQRAYVVINAGYVLGIVFSEYPAFTEQDALDECADHGKLDGLQCDETELNDYQTGSDSEGNPEYEGIVQLGNASEPFASESLDIWVFPASVFAEDPCLMTFDRVMSRLEDMRNTAEHAYKATNTDDPAWSVLYQAACDADDTITLAGLVGAR